MGNIGRSSTGCFLCRKRKIKCDERREGGCQKCERIRQPCPGYPFVLELAIRDCAAEPVPDSAAAFVLSITPPLTLPPPISRPSIPLLLEPFPPEPVSPEPLPLTVASSLRDEFVTDSQETQSIGETCHHASKVKTELMHCDCACSKSELDLMPQHKVPEVPPKYDVTHQSTCYFLHLFCYQASQLYGAPLFDYLPNMLVTVDQNHCLHQSVKAVSRMALADRYSGNDIRLRTSKDYIQALSATKAVIKDSDSAVKDETVVAVWLLSLYEALTNVLSYGRVAKDEIEAEKEWQSHISHIRGCMHLLKLRGNSQFTTPRAEKIYRVFKAAIQMRLFMLNSITSTDFETLEQDVYQDEHEFLPSRTAVKATRYFHSVTHLLEVVKFALRACKEDPTSVENTQRLQKAVSEAEELDLNSSDWAKGEPGWGMMKVQASTAGTMWSLYPLHAVYYFQNFWVYLYWLRCLIARVKLYEGLITVLEVQKQSETIAPCALTTKSVPVSTSYEFKLAKYKTILQLTAGQIIGLTAYVLGDITNSGQLHSPGMPDDSAAGTGTDEGVNHTSTNNDSSKTKKKVKTREINVVATMQLAIPLKVLQRSKHPTPTQKGAIDLALSHIGDGFRREHSRRD